MKLQKKDMQERFYGHKDFYEVLYFTNPDTKRKQNAYFDNQNEAQDFFDSKKKDAIYLVKRNYVKNWLIDKNPDWELDGQYFENTKSKVVPKGEFKNEIEPAND